MDKLPRFYRGLGSSNLPEGTSNSFREIYCLIMDEAQEVQSSMTLDVKERDELREVLRLSIGDHVSKFSEEDLDDFGMTMLEVTAIVLKAKQSQEST